MSLTPATNPTIRRPAVAGGQFDTSYARLPERFYARLAPTPVRSPRLVKFNSALAHELGLEARQWASEKGAAILSGNSMPEWAQPLAMAYAGHQFGHFSPQLGDGRAILLGEIIAGNGTRYDLHLKGAGRTPFSRRGDGRATLGPMLREYIISEAMHALGIPTTRSLAVVATGEPVLRETVLPGALVARVAASHLRVGTFEYFAAKGDVEAVRILADYAIDRHYPEIKANPTPYLSLLAAVCEAQASLVARWMQVGFIHGVMNTDNMTISGETIDYGPCAFMDEYSPATVFSSIDHQGRYAFGNQPHIAHWNLVCLANTLLPLVDTNHEKSIPLAEEVINQFPGHFARHWRAGMRRKLGLVSEQPEDVRLIEDLLTLMQEHAADYTNTFRQLCAVAEGEATLPGYEAWGARWQTRLGQESHSRSAAAALMRTHNPAVIPRNHQVEAALNAAVRQENFAPLETLLVVLSTPFDLKPEYAQYSAPPAPEERVQQTFCGT